MNDYPFKSRSSPRPSWEYEEPIGGYKKVEMSKEERIIQWTKIVIGVVGGLVLIYFLNQISNQLSQVISLLR